MKSQLINILMQSARDNRIPVEVCDIIADCIKGTNHHTVSRFRSVNAATRKYWRENVAYINVKCNENNKHIRDLVVHIKRLPKLTALNLSYNAMEQMDMDALKELTQLTYLKLDGIVAYNPDYLTPITNLTNLTHLSMKRVLTPYLDIATVATLSKLTSLNISVNCIINEDELTHLTKLVHLTELDISEIHVRGGGVHAMNQTITIPALHKLTHLKADQVRGFRLSKRDMLPSMTHLSLRRTLQPSNLTDLATHTQLERLDFREALVCPIAVANLLDWMVTTDDGILVCRH